MMVPQISHGRLYLPGTHPPAGLAGGGLQLTQAEFLGKAFSNKRKGSAGSVLARGGEFPIYDLPVGTRRDPQWFPESGLN